MIPSEKPEALALLYHLNSEPWKGGELETDGSDIPQFKEVVGDESPVLLPRPPVDSPLMRVIQSRRSCRSYRAGTMPIAGLAEMLRGAYGLTQDRRLPGLIDHPARSVPSAGALYPLEFYVATGTVEGVVDGLYHYSILDHSLEVLFRGKVLNELGTLLLLQHHVESACAIIIITAVFRRSLPRYGARGYRYILLEAGHATQNICLIATELGLGTLCLGGFFDSRLNRLLGLDGISEAALYCVAAGYPSG
jgi:SagB-type dehydrogenase family enzyme